MPRDPALDDISVLNDPNWKPPTANDIADWSRSAIKILSLSDDLGTALNHTLADSQRVRSSIVLKRSALENEFNSVDRTLTAQLATMPESIEGMNVLLKKNRQKALAERQTREMLIADGFMDPEQAKEILEDDAALVEIGSKRLKQLLTPIGGEDEDEEEDERREGRTSGNSGSEGERPAEQQRQRRQSKGEDAQDRRQNNHANPSSTASALPKKKGGRRRRRKRGAKKKMVGGSTSTVLASASLAIQAPPSVESNLDASSRILAIMEAERKREIFRQETLHSIQDQSKELQQMTKLFNREKKQAEKMIAQMLGDYVPRPIPKQSPTKQQSKQAKARFKPNKLATPSPMEHHRGGSGGGGLVNQLRDSLGRGPQKNFNTINKMPGNTLEVKPPPVPDNLETDTLHLEYTHAAHDSMKDLIADHTDGMDLSFPEIEKYKKPGSEYARYLEKNLV